MENLIHLPGPTLGINGRLHWEIFDKQTRKVVQSGEQGNVIVNAGLNDLFNANTTIGTNVATGAAGLTQFAAVGTQAAPAVPAVTDIALQTELVRVSDAGGQDDVAALNEATSGAYYAELTRTRQFTAAQVQNQNLTEWGFFRLSVGAPMWCRELFRDEAGNPIVLTPATGQGLRFVYTVRLTFSQLLQTLINQTYFGNADVTVDWVVNKAATTNTSFAANFFRYPSTVSGVSENTYILPSELVATAPAYTTTPNRTGELFRSSSSQAIYTADSFQRDLTLTWGIATANAGPYAHILVVLGSNLFWYRFTQPGPVAGIPAKTNLQEYRFTIRPRIVRT
jgi:hypothetical protein